MKLLVKGAEVVDKYSSKNSHKVNILIDNGTIVEISTENIEAENVEVFEAEGLKVSPGWVDLGVHYKDPGFEWLEDTYSMAEAAAAGGYTHVIGFPNTQPVVQTKEAIAYYRNFNKLSVVELLNLAAVTKGCKGEDFTDMIDLTKGGAVGFSDGKEAIQNTDIFLKTLQYLEPLQVPLVVKSEDKYLSMYGQMHEGVTSTLLGMKGIPSAAEEIMILRNLKLLEYSGVKSEKSLLHFSTLSTKGSVQLIREAKAKGLPVSCDVAAHHLVFTDEDLMGFDTNFKVYPPFRAQQDIDALIEGLEDGTIDFIVSDHNSWDSEHKTLEFDMAEFGAIGLQTVFPVALANLGLEAALDKIVYGPREMFNLGKASIEVGQKADFTLFDTEEEYIFQLDQIKSKGKNSPFLGVSLSGKAKAIFNNGIFKLVN